MDRYVVKRPQGEAEGGGKRPRPAEPPSGQPPWQEIRAEGLNCDYRLLFGKAEADEIFQRLEEEVEYFEGEMTKLHVFAVDPSSQPYQRPHRFGHWTYF
ncbi:PREDICTED: DNA oxidative demethylase ALKBH2 isoform X2 [Calidris pugnax]|uniref:DNA oxidative demethylase ALKBH2 isoform X2 n=1 Tax=Calidris pugnax TaxID=198806 RepID=UPI00071DF632|nr:PREDICTED: DNA oxidative demethylase ALKBH2 isoform X2 [Calidris pugnax]